MAVNKYIGARYVPLVMGEWNNGIAYEPLSIVLYQGNSYTSICYVPIGAEITDEKYWALSGNYNAQVEKYRKEVETVKQDIDQIEIKIPEIESAIAGLSSSIDTLKEELPIVRDKINSAIIDLQSHGIVLSSAAKIKTVGSSEYPTIRSVTDSIADNDTTLILIPKGDYNMLLSYPVTEFPNGYLFPSNTYLIGLGSKIDDVKLISALSTFNNLYSTINCQGNFGMFNLMAKSVNCRYVIHDDFGSNDYATRIFKSCILTSLENYYHGIGGSLRGNANVIYEDCYIEGGGTTTVDAIYYHNSAGGGHGTLTYKGCRFNTNGSKIVSDVGFAMSENAGYNSVTCNFIQSPANNISVGTNNETPLYINSDIDIPILYSYNYAFACMPRFLRTQPVGALTQGHLVQYVSTNNGVTDSTDPYNSIGFCCKFDASKLYYVIVKRGCWCSCTELGFAVPSNVANIYFASNGTLTYTPGEIVMGIAYPNGVCRFYDAPYIEQKK